MTINEIIVTEVKGMPRALTEHEKEQIKIKLLEVAENQMFNVGIKKITVDDLVKGAQIAKGTFYLFYENKERLFYEVFRLRHDEIQGRFITDLSNCTLPLSADKLTGLIYNLCESLDQSFIFSLAKRGDLELLMRKIPESLLTEHIEKDDLSIKKLLTLFPHIEDPRIEVYSAAFRIALISIMHKNEVGAFAFNEALKLTLKGIIVQMMEENSHD
jgi:AcrR family transcriptional regulator